MLDNQGARYDLIAEGFANLRSEFNTEQKYLDLFISYLPNKASILDVGCGSGIPIAAYLVNKGFNVTGVDGSQKLLDIAKSNVPQMTCVYGDVRDVVLDNKYDGIIEWWCLFHIPKKYHSLMFQKFVNWLKPGGVIEFTTGDSEYEATFSDMLNQPLDFYSHNPTFYEKQLLENSFKLLLKENDQDQHLVWIAQYQGL